MQTEIVNAKATGHLICIQMDANSKFGRNIIDNDPCEKYQKMVESCSIIEQENLVLVNSTEKCVGTITSFRETTKKTEKSVIDFFILCRRLYEILKNMFVDDN